MKKETKNRAWIKDLKYISVFITAFVYNELLNVSLQYKNVK